MNAHQQWLPPRNINNIQNDRSINMNKCREYLKHLTRSIKESNVFNNQAKEYLVNARREVNALNLHKNPMSTAHMIKDVPQGDPGK